MNKSSITIRIFTHVAAGLLMGAGAYQLGLEKGHKQGVAVQEQRSKLSHGLNTAVYLIHAEKDVAGGNPDRATRMRHQLLYGSAMDMQDAIDSGRLSPAELGELRSGQVLAEVAAYFHRHPETATPIEEDPFTRHLVPKLRELMKKHDPAGK